MPAASAPHKIILFGEHAVVHGRLGIAGAIDRRITVGARRCDNGVSCIDPLHLNSFRADKEELTNLLERFRSLHRDKKFDEIKKLGFLNAIKVVVAATLEKCGWADVEVELQRKEVLKGIGGSAAIWAATAAALGRLLGKDLTKDEINDIAYLGDVVAHGGTPSGIDNSTVTYGGYLKFTKADGPRPLDIKCELPLVVVDSGEPANTGVTVPYVREQLEADPGRVNRILDELHAISEAALDALEKRDLEKIGQLMTSYYEELRKLNISTEKLDLIVKIALGAGALGAKPTGGWGGGVCIALARDGKHANELIRIFAQHGFRAFTAALGAPGVRLEG